MLWFLRCTVQTSFQNMEISSWFSTIKLLDGREKENEDYMVLDRLNRCIYQLAPMASMKNRDAEGKVLFLIRSVMRAYRDWQHHREPSRSHPINGPSMTFKLCGMISARVRQNYNKLVKMPMYVSASHFGRREKTANQMISPPQMRYFILRFLSILC